MFQSKRLGLIFSILFVCLASGCAQIQLGKPLASAENIQHLKSKGISAVRLGDFSPAVENAMWDKKLSIRGNILQSPENESFSSYLRLALGTELAAAGLLNEDSNKVIQATLLENSLNAAGASTGNASLGARFSILVEGASVFEKEFRVDSTWESSFIGAVAIPAAINEYTSSYRDLVSQLLRDPDFIAALTQ